VEGGASIPEAWRDLFVEATDPEAFGIVAELQAAVESAAWDDAARIVMQIEPQQADKLAACPWEVGLRASVRQTVELACARFPPLRQAIAQRYAAWGRERVEQAIAAGHRPQIEQATWQLAGTAAAKRAHRWLADQALADGAFAEALRHYDAVADDPLEAAEVAPRRRLAAALLGRELGQPPEQPVVLGTQTLTPEAFEVLVREALERAQPAVVASRPAGSKLPPGTLAVHSVPATLPVPGPVPREAGLGTFRGTALQRHLASATDGSRLFTSTRCQLFAIDLEAGKQLWAEPPTFRGPQSGEFVGTPMRPVVAADRIYVRWLVGAETKLACLDTSLGQVLWKWEPSQAVISDPVLVGQTLVVVGLSRQPQRQLSVQAYILDPRSGALRRRNELVLVREQWATRDCLLVAGDEDGLVAALGGVSLGIDPEGKLRWVRTHRAVPPEEDPLWNLQQFQPPLIDQEDVFLTQPGVWTVDCVHRISGQRRWHKVLPELVGLIGKTEGTLVVRCLEEIVGLDARTGQLRWRHDRSDVLEAVIAGSHVLLLCRVAARPGALERVEAVWLDARTGAVAGRALVPELEGAAVAVGGAVLAPQGLAVWFQPNGQQATAQLRLLRLKDLLTAGWQPPTPWESLAEASAAP
jgi:outer membrane protein assembly factor BamB